MCAIWLYILQERFEIPLFGRLSMTIEPFSMPVLLFTFVFEGLVKHENWEARVRPRVLSTFMRAGQTRWELMMRVDTGCYSVTQTKLVVFLNCKFCTILLSLLLKSANRQQLCNSHQLSWLVKRAQTLINSQNLNQFKVDESAWELAVKL